MTANTTPRTHELKCWPEFYQAIAVGYKTFEVRKDDRGFAVGDILWLREWKPDTYHPDVFERTGNYTGRELRRKVTYLFDLGCPMIDKRGYVVLALEQELAAARAETLKEAAKVAKNSNFVDGPKGTIEGQIADAILAPPDAKGQTKAGTAPGREEPTSPWFKLRFAIQQGFNPDTKLVMAEDYDALSAELERVKGEKDAQYEHDYLAPHKGCECHYCIVLQRATTAEASVEQMRERELESQRLDWLDKHCSFVADPEYKIGPFQVGELRQLADAGIAADWVNARIAASENSGGSHE